MTTPLLSVILPVYNGARFLRDALACIRAQTIFNAQCRREIIAIDDGSTDDGATAAALSHAHAAGEIELHETLPENRGPAAARNAGLRHARGEWIAFFDVDDAWPNDHLAQLHQRLIADPAMGFAVAEVQCQRLDDAGCYVDFGARGQLPSFPAGLFRRDVFTRVGPLDEKMRAGEDVDWFLRAREAGVTHATVADTTLFYRLHDTNTSRDRTAAHGGMLRALQQSVQRRRATALPSVSVILPLRNGARYLAECLESILAQTHPPLEVLVMDDQSTDGSRELALRYATRGVRFVANESRLGIAGSLNAGIALARGELLAFNSHDDIWEPRKLQLQATLLQSQPHLLFCLAHVRPFLDEGQEPPPGFPRERLDQSVPGYLIETLVARPAAFARIGPFDTTMAQANDTDWYARAQDLRAPMQVLPDCLVRKRVHATNITYGAASAPRLQSELLEVVRRTVARKRTQPRVSVIIPVHDGDRYLAAALESALAQTRPAAEICVVDDGSRDASAAIAASFAPRGVRCVSQLASGAAAARNRGVAETTGDLIAFLDADDLWTSDKLAAQCARFQSDSALDLVFSHAEQFVSADLAAATRARLQCPAVALPGYLPGAMLVRRAAFARVGPFETRWELGELIAWLAHARELGLREILLPETHLRRRLHDRNQGQQKRHHYADYARILKETLDRRRAQTAV